MKKLLLMLALLGGAATGAQAQSAISAGTFSLGGNVGYTSTTEEYTNTASGNTNSSSTRFSNFSLGFTAGAFVVDNLELGLQVAHRISGGEITNSNGGPTSSPPSSSELRLGPYVN